MEKLRILFGHFKTSDVQSVAAEEADGLVKRLATKDDIEALEKLNEHFDFDIGLSNLCLYYSLSPSSWNVIENERKEIIAYDSCNRLPNGIVFGFQRCVRDEYQGRGITSRYFITTEREYPKGMIGNASLAGIKRYNFVRIWLWKIISFYGLVPSLRMFPDFSPSSVNLHRLTPQKTKLFTGLLKYDKSIIGFDRSEFLKVWTGIDSSVPTRTLVAIDSQSKTVVGYGVIRRFSNYWGISPVYADSAEIGKQLLWGLIEQTFFGADRLADRSGEFIYLAFSATSKVSLEFASAAKLFQIGVEQRQCDSTCVSYTSGLPESKIFAMHEYWPC